MRAINLNEPSDYDALFDLLTPPTVPDFDTVKRIVTEKNLDVNIVSGCGQTLLSKIYLHYRGNNVLRLIQILLKLGADPNALCSANNSVKAPLLWMMLYWDGWSRQFDADIFRTLLENGADVNIRGGMFKSTPLWYACKIGNIAAVKILIKHGANTTLEDTNLFTARDIAVKTDRAYIVSYLDKMKTRKFKCMRAAIIICSVKSTCYSYMNSVERKEDAPVNGSILPKELLQKIAMEVWALRYDDSHIPPPVD